ncbi:hypothetical protein SAY86_012800 [Trapa natans]|uniref:non-specific serine/threonine protein kinase n=1 Tax=Trapa natans TaxID=22666 RepID=A0AAN7RBX3_TRANT|nr:hypothetical protein SAY86_012800 [Trapa natans]
MMFIPMLCLRLLTLSMSLQGKADRPLSFEKERAYFEEVDAFELLEESPSPKSSSTWVVGNQTDLVALPHISSRLERWLMSKRLNFNTEPSSTLSAILETPVMVSNLETPNVPSWPIISGPHSILKSIGTSSKDKISLGIYTNMERVGLALKDGGEDSHEDLDAAIRKLSLASTSESNLLDPFTALLGVCGQSSPPGLLDIFSKYCNPESITKIGEGTFGEAFKAGSYVCKIVPIDGDLQVNGEVQKRSEELLEEVILSRTLNQLRVLEDDAPYQCSMFIETVDIKVCQGSYDAPLIKAWEEWDEKNGSENDHPKQFPEKQSYVVLVLEHGGKDLESFVLLNFDEAKSLLIQVTIALAVAEAAYEFEHRDLHWGNILLNRNDSSMTRCTLEGNQMTIKTFGLCVSIIDFTLSRINTGKDILFLDLSTDPDLFRGPKGDRQSETYRMMKKVTGDYWEGSFPRTNVLWLLYLVDILLLKKSFARSSSDERELRSLKKRLDKYSSAKEALADEFFSELFIDSSPATGK